MDYEKMTRLFLYPFISMYNEEIHIQWTIFTTVRFVPNILTYNRIRCCEEGIFVQ